MHDRMGVNIFNQIARTQQASYETCATMASRKEFKE